MTFCRHKTKTYKAFRVGYHMIPGWLWKDKKNNDMAITGGSINGEFEINITCRHFVAEKGDWIVSFDGVLVKYTHEEFKKIFEVFERGTNV